MSKNPRPDSPRISYEEHLVKFMADSMGEGKFTAFMKAWREERVTGERSTAFLFGRWGGLRDGVYSGYRYAQVEIAQALYGDGDNGMTQAQVARAVGTSQATVSRLLKDPDPWEEHRKRMRARGIKADESSP